MFENVYITDGGDEEEDTEESEQSPPIEKVVTTKPKLETGKQGKVVENSIAMLNLLKDPSDTAARVKRLAQTLQSAMELADFDQLNSDHKAPFRKVELGDFADWTMNYVH